MRESLPHDDGHHLPPVRAPRRSAWAATFTMRFRPPRAVFQEVDEALGESLSRLMFEGEESELTLTRNAQPALMAVSVRRGSRARGRGRLAAQGARCLRRRPFARANTPHLPAAGCLALADAARLLRLRGEAMQQAVPVGAGAMAALIGADLAQAAAIAEERRLRTRSCVVGNDNAPGQVVISGATSAVERAVALAPDHGIKRAVTLPVSAPFHSPLLAPAAETMAAAFENVPFMPLAVPVVSNVTARPVHEASDVAALLVRQVTAMVRWRESVLYMAGEGVDTLIEVGAGRVLTGLAQGVSTGRSAQARSAPSPTSMPCWGGRLRRGRQRQQGAARDVRSVGKGGAGHGRIGRYRRSHRRGPSPPGGGSGALRPARGCAGGAGCAVGRGRPCGALRSRRSRRPRGPARTRGGGSRCAAILVHCGGITRDGLALRMKDEDWQEVLDVNLSAGFVLARACLHGMLRPALGAAHLHHLGGGHDRHAGQANYAASKAGSRGW